MKKQTLFLILVIAFAILTFCGAGYVLYNKGQVNAGFAVIPMIIELVFLLYIRAEKTKNKRILTFQKGELVIKKKLLYLVFPVIALILEILPYGAVCNFATKPNETIRKTFSYFDLTPFGYANFPPFLTAIITCSVLALLAVNLFADKPRMLKLTKAFVCVGVVLSVCPLLYGINYYPLVGALITVSLIAELVVLFVTTSTSSK